MMASLVICLLMTTADIRFSIELLLERRLVWEKIFLPYVFATYFLLCKRFNFSHFKVQIWVCYQIINSWITFSIWTHFNPLFNRMFYFVEWIAWSVPVYNHLDFSTSLWVGNSYFDSFHQKREKSTSVNWKWSTKIKRLAKWVHEFY